jgi:hypothetical protein
MDSAKGCTVDLVTSDTGDEFEFMVVLVPEEGKTPNDCLTTDTNENMYVHSIAIHLNNEYSTSALQASIQLRQKQQGIGTV